MTRRRSHREDNDDRMFVLSVSKWTIEVRRDEFVETRVYDETAPQDHAWCLITFRNTSSHPAVRVEHFARREGAARYRLRVEPEVPGVSLDGNPPEAVPTGKAFARWKIEQQLGETTTDGCSRAQNQTPGRLLRPTTH